MSADNYIGFKVSVQLQNGIRFQGIVSEITGSKLRLINVFDTATSTYVPSRVIDGSKIADLQILKAAGDLAEDRNTKSKKKKQPTEASQSASSTSLQDPAIMSLSSVAANSYSGPSFALSPITVRSRQQTDDSESFDEGEIYDNDDGVNNKKSQANMPSYGSPWPKRSNKQRSISGRQSEQIHIREPSATFVPQPFTGSSRRNGRSGRQSRQAAYYADNEGWASEDTSGYKDTEFDFQSNLDRFDKKSVFDEIRLADKTDPRSRLVSFNRRDANEPSAHELQQQRIRELIKRPSKKDFLPTENVLGTKSSEWQGVSSEGEDTEDESATGIPAEEEVSEIDRAIKQQHLRRISHAMPRTSSRNTTPPGLQFSLPPRRLIYNANDHGTTFVCPTFSITQMALIEKAAVSQYSLHPVQLTENAGSAIAKLAIQVLGGKRRFERRRIQPNALPVVVVLVGNHETGARAIAGARMLVNRRVRVVVLFTDDSSELASPKESIEQQMRAFKAAGGKVTSRLDVLQATLKVLDAPPEVIIDALQGLDVREDATVRLCGIPAWMYEAGQWASSQRAPVMAVDAPAGMDPDSGTVMVNNMGKAKWILSLGMPAAGMPRFLQYVEEVAHLDVDVAVADIGIPRRCFKKALDEQRSIDEAREGVIFGSEWAVGVELE
ncbi:YjeF N-terminal domain-containing protein [Lipomyces tetrasporus]|uniref:Enhancer of mRNA-decapping protein 3 n=1 Tax=Lipomyces tetrasporus TaxID=54092 RepID=A0AAD7QZ08_9ASCO|nr:YjeF N-terminal domain-containing protein [Lipomyces tetrasporus]KAJ8104075.1 YjeF N-terminal domain-containing protein [Lipomyces tetrasporus]